MFFFNQRLANGQLANYDEKTGIFYGCIQINNGLLNSWVAGEELWSGGPEVICHWAPEQYEVDEDTGLPTTELIEDCGEPMYWELDDQTAGVQGLPCMDDTFARQCSPCVPNAGDLDNTGKDETVKCYCPPSDWYEEGKAPAMWHVVDDTVVLPAATTDK